ncbi:autotransporter outer membrane beta-barrel domain-containing protein [Escherichia coli]|nr:autotransporter outer membrane beta-barrel domain-containing protein [Escherichia coli]AFJ27391.1 hypothetical protein CDCO157_0342 [Escherichia coli Xuzhou21]ASE46878.1 autotransporter outer membrane beta-barrel domain-containing protein [Escherichia coli O157]ANG66971.2 autotransporter outer membrane beta-barrel domain-containing protein [Escherichia coli O157:H7]ANG72520.2 autotransporter outer membrane beta-barrel domain-containing protein [Escherichia coli O157:H7]ANG78151.2 autotransp
MPVYLCKTSLSGMLRDPQLLMLWLRLGDESVNASIDGAAFRVGAGVQADITKNMGAYASLDYTKGDDIENPLQGVVGINVTW